MRLTLSSAKRFATRAPSGPGRDCHTLAESEKMPRMSVRWIAAVCTVAGTLVLVSVVLAALIWLVQRHFIWPSGLAGRGLGGLPTGAVQLWRDTPDGPVEAWYFPAPGASPASPAPVVVFFHGNAELIDHNLDVADLYRPWGVSVLLVEYRGYGRSASSPSRGAIREDVVGFVADLVSRPEVDQDRLVYHGRSLGGAVAADLAVLRPPRALILVSTFTSMESMFRRTLVPGFLARDRYRTADVLASLDRPVLVVHGRRDTVVPVAHGRALSRLGDHVTYLEIDADHNLPLDRPDVASATLGLLKTARVVADGGTATRRSVSP